MRRPSPGLGLTSAVADSEIASAKTQFSLKFNSALWFMTTGLQFLVGWWYRKSAVFYLPHGWFGPLTWWLGLPWAPTGSVSCVVWQTACRRIISVMERTVKDLWRRSISTSLAWIILTHFISSPGRGTPTDTNEGEG